MKLPLVLSTGLTLASATALPSKRETKVSYDGHQVVRLATHHEVDSVRSKLANLPYTSLNLDTDDHLDVVVAPKDLPAFRELGLEGTVLHEDLGNDLQSEGQLASYQAHRGALPDLSWYEAYHSYEDHQEYLYDLQASFANHSEIVTTGESYEGRPIEGIHFWGKDGKDAHQTILWHGTVHAREWITPKTTEYLTLQLIGGYLNGTQEIVDIVDKFDFYVFPVVNPDGFIYSYETDRLWRKTRQPRANATCIGTDVNRNWPYNWDVEGGASDNPCDQTYRGEAAGDTPELQGVKGLVDKLAAGNGIAQYVDWHSFGQYILLPYGYDCNETADNHEYQLNLASEVASIIEEESGSVYTYGASCGVLYASTGSSVDYVSAEGRAEVAWTVELRPESQGGGGFVLPADEILATVEEQWAGFKWLLSTQ